MIYIFLAPLFFFVFTRKFLDLRASIKSGNSDALKVNLLVTFLMICVSALMVLAIEW